MIVPKIIKRSERNSLALTIDDKGDLIVKAPRQMQLEEIFAFINKKQKWIEEKQTKTKSILQKNFEVVNYEKMFYLGKLYPIFQTNRVDETYISQDGIIINKTRSLNNQKAQLKQFLIDRCDDVLLPRILKHLDRTKAEYSEIKIISSKAKWGMCDSKKILYFNYKLLMLSPQLIDYVIVHEICHLSQLNHSAKFWKLVAKQLPNYKQCQAQLKDCGFLIKLF